MEEVMELAREEDNEENSEADGDGTTMERLRELGLDLVAEEEQSEGVGTTGEIVRLSCELEEWVREHLTKRAEREGGLTHENVLRVLASTQMRKKVKEEGGE